MTPPSLQRRSLCWRDNWECFYSLLGGLPRSSSSRKEAFHSFGWGTKCTRESIWSAAGQVFTLSRAEKADYQLFVSLSVPPLYRQSHPAQLWCCWHCTHRDAAPWEFCPGCWNCFPGYFLCQVSKAVFNLPVARFIQQDTHLCHGQSTLIIFWRYWSVEKRKYSAVKILEV